MFKREDGEAAAGRVMAVLADVSEQIMVVGSLRRGKALVKDAEITMQPKDLTTALGRLDGMIARGEACQAIYDNGTPRWGEKYRGLLVDGIKVEVFITTPENFGFITWLRTGPSDSNTFVMKWMEGRKWPMRFIEGHGWHVRYDTEGALHRLEKLKLATEADLFKALNIGSMIPSQRELIYYQDALRKAAHLSTETLTRMYADAPKPAIQNTLF
jgi:hypothetical protein